MSIRPSWLRITSPYFVAGIMAGGDCAPIVGYLKGKTLRFIRDYCRGKGWKLEEFYD